MHRIETADALEGWGLFFLALVAFTIVWYLVGYLFGDTDKKRTPAQNFFRRTAGWIHWWVYILLAGLHGMDAGLMQYYRLMEKKLPAPRNEAVRVPEAFPVEPQRERVFEPRTNVLLAMLRRMGKA